MQGHNPNQDTFIVYHRQKLNRRWRCLHLLHRIHRHCLRTNSSRIPNIHKTVLSSYSCILHNRAMTIISYAQNICTVSDLVVFSDQNWSKLKFYLTNLHWHFMQTFVIHRNQPTTLILIRKQHKKASNASFFFFIRRIEDSTNEFITILHTLRNQN